MSYKEELMSYEDDAEDQFDDYDGYDDDEEDDFDEYDEYDDDEEDDFDTGLDGMDDDGYDDDGEYDDYVDAYEEDMYDDYSKKSIGRINSNDRTLTVQVINTSGAAAEAILFGGNELAPQPAGVEVTIKESSHNEVRRSTTGNPFMIMGMKLSVSNPLQFDNVMRITKRTTTGTMQSRVYQARNATSPQNFSNKLIDDHNFSMEVTGEDSLRFMILDGVTAVFTFTIKARTKIGNLLQGKNVAELSRAPRTTGLPQLDLAYKRKRYALAMRRRKRRKRRVYYGRKRPVRYSRNRYRPRYRSRLRRR